jgi:hypothetical protein
MAFARDVEILLNDGRKFRGTLVSERPDSITLRMSGVESTYQRSRIKSMITVQSLDEEYRSKRAKLQDNDYTGRFGLARELYNKKLREADELALIEVESILKDKPDHPLSLALRSALKSRLKAAPPAPVTPAKPKTPVSPTAPKPTAPSASTAPALLSKDDIALMKVYEVNLDNNPKVVVPRTLTDKILTTKRDSDVMSQYLSREGERKFRTLKPVDQLDAIFAIGDRELYKEVKILNEPETLNYFRTKINSRYVIGYCGKCHGARNPAPGLTVHTLRGITEQTAYSNLALLRIIESKDGIPLIFKSSPERSPLLEYGLPPEFAKTPHPEAPQYRPFFKNTEDPNYQDYLEWISLLFGDNESYPVQIRVP